ncbi:TRAP transporter small permease [Oceanisphaera psychrotolerans]|nr:TRAP transporter small permease [Oceanisphaera psychrotolerans]
MLTRLASAINDAGHCGKTRMLTRIAAVIGCVCHGLAAAGVATLAALVSYVVFMRWVIGQPPHWAEELPQLILLWSTLLGAVACSYHRSHLSAGLLPLVVRSARWLKVFTHIGDVLVLIMLLMITKAGWALAMLTMSQTTTALQIPAGISYLAVPVGCAAMALVQFIHLFTRGDSQ